MKKHLFCTTAAMAAIASHAVPADASSYIKGFAGVNFVDDEHLGSTSGTLYVSSHTAYGAVGAEILADDGYIVGAAFGWDLMDNWDLEIELAYRQNDINGAIWVSGTIYGPTYSGTGYYTTLEFDLGNVSALSVMANVWYEFENESKWTPFIGGGLGWADVDVETLAGDTSDSGLAYQIGVGVNFELSPATDIGIEYRFFSMTDDDYAVFGGYYDYDYQAQSIMVSMRVNY